MQLVNSSGGKSAHIPYSSRRYRYLCKEKMEVLIKHLYSKGGSKMYPKYKSKE